MARGRAGAARGGTAAATNRGGRGGRGGRGSRSGNAGGGASGFTFGDEGSRGGNADDLHDFYSNAEPGSYTPLGAAVEGALEEGNGGDDAASPAAGGGGRSMGGSPSARPGLRPYLSSTVLTNLETFKARLASNASEVSTVNTGATAPSSGGVPSLFAAGFLSFSLPNIKLTPVQITNVASAPAASAAPPLWGTAVPQASTTIPRNLPAGTHHSGDTATEPAPAPYVGPPLATAAASSAQQQSNPTNPAVPMPPPSQAGATAFSFPSQPNTGATSAGGYPLQHQQQLQELYAPTMHNANLGS